VELVRVSRRHTSAESIARDRRPSACQGLSYPEKSRRMSYIIGIWSKFPTSYSEPTITLSSIVCRIFLCSASALGLLTRWGRSCFTRLAGAFGGRKERHHDGHPSYSTTSPGRNARIRVQGRLRRLYRDVQGKGDERPFVSERLVGTISYSACRSYPSMRSVRQAVRPIRHPRYHLDVIVVVLVRNPLSIEPWML
jgi:hypothetical protein